MRTELGASQHLLKQSGWERTYFHLPVMSLHEIFGDNYLSGTAELFTFQLIEIWIILVSEELTQSDFMLQISKAPVNLGRGALMKSSPLLYLSSTLSPCRHHH